VPHPTAWKAPLYPAWVGFWYELLGPSPAKLAIVQGLLLAPATVLLTWLTARRWFGLRTAGAAAAIVAIFPLVWEFYGLLYSEALVIPLVLLVVYLVVDRPPPRPLGAAGIGALIGICMLVRPTSFFLLALVAAAWVVASSWRRALVPTLIALVGVVVALAPWTIRNAVVLDGFLPISIQDAAAYGTFNSEAANDPLYPYAFRVFPEGVAEELAADPPTSELEFRSRLQARAREYVLDNPESVPQAFFWNGISRLWDLRRPARALDEPDFEGRSDVVTAVGLGLYYVLLPLALLALWRLRRRRELVIPLVAMALALSLVFTIQAGTRYRAPVEPVIVILACSNLALGGERRSYRGARALNPA
jgi:4-amino-4-deoxy-L-arabinose transferase-like glycosyltransferase